MPFRYVARALLVALALPGTAFAQSGWRVGVAAAAPARILEVNEMAVPDSNDGRVKLGMALGAEASRWWGVAPNVSVTGFARLMTAPVEAATAAGTWSAGRAFIVDVGARAEREVSPGASLFAGAGLSHWAGPDATAPFAGAAALMLTSEAGLTMHPGNRRTRIDLTANVTRFGADESRNVVTGFVWRFLVGVRRGL